jgi:hypothetical protein
MGKGCALVHQESSQKDDPLAVVDKSLDCVSVIIYRVIIDPPPYYRTYIGSSTVFEKSCASIILLQRNL